MKNAILLVLFAFGLSVARGDETKTEEPSIVFPMRVFAEKAAGVTTRTEIIDTIKPGVWYVIRSKEPLFVLDAPQGSVSIISGPVSVDGIFADGNGKSETRVFDPAESTYLIQGLKPCKTELILIPVGVTERAAVVRQVLTVSGSGPEPPPPIDPPEPDPDPDKPPEPTKKSFRVIFVKESGVTLNAAQSSIPDAKAISEYLDAKTTEEDGQVGWRTFDPDDKAENEPPVMKKLWEAVKPKLHPAPCMVVELDSAVVVKPFPANVAECLKILKRYGGEINE